MVRAVAGRHQIEGLVRPGQALDRPPHGFQIVQPSADGLGADDLQHGFGQVIGNRLLSLRRDQKRNMAAAAAQIQRDAGRPAVDDQRQLLQILADGMDRTVKIGPRPGAELVIDDGFVRFSKHVRLHSSACDLLTPAKVGEILNWYKKAFYPGIIIAMIAIHPRRALGAFIRAHRERLPPPAAFSGRRRTPGFRREELAEACGVSATWISWLEQGREVSASPHALARLAEALRLASAERAYLFTLAGKRDPAEPAPTSHDLPPEVLGLPERMIVETATLQNDM